MAKHRTNYKKGRKAFTVFYILLVLILAAAILWLLRFAWKGSAEYEANSPASIMDGIAERYSGYAAGQFSYSKVYNESSDGGKLHYALYADGKPFAKVTLRMQEKLGMAGLKLYEEDSVEGLLEFSVQAPENAFVYAGDKLVSSDYIVESGIPIADLASLVKIEDFPVKIPCDVVYKQTALLSLPKLSATSFDGSTPCVCEKDGKNSAVFSNTMSDEALEAWWPYLENFVSLYSGFLSEDSSWKKLSPYVLKSAPVYKNLLNAPIGGFPYHSKVEIVDLAASEYIAYSEDIYKVRLTYIYRVEGNSSSGYHYVTDFDNDMTFWFVNTPDNGWQLCDMRIN